MKYLYTLSLFLLIGCSQNKDVIIENNNKTFKSGETFVIELYAPIHNEVMPSFYIIDDQDTLGLPFDFEKGCATFTATHEIKKKHIYSGYVEYNTELNKITKSEFEIKYRIR